ncbi:MAG: class II D-tagatose-bisphosphate aldolase, non-catalytic subunit, partial [Paracoccaceae bacterium]|nr:class II D-tagatose-bisphosphate aldolase, non-catalytic subunit [Paracoccaceae bacterium]
AARRLQLLVRHMRPIMSEILRDIIARNNAGECIAIPSVCSANPEVISASPQLASSLNRPLVIDATSNQVNQFGGYTGMDAQAIQPCQAAPCPKHENTCPRNLIREYKNEWANRGG